MPITLQALAEACGANIQNGNPTWLLNAAADINNADTGHVIQLTSPRYSHHLKDTAASACFIKPSLLQILPFTVPDTLALLVCDDPELSFIKAINLLHPEPCYPDGIASQAVLADSVQLGEHVHIAPYAVIGADSHIDNNTAILAGVSIGQRVKIGQNCRIHPYAVIYDDVVIGDNVTIHAGAIIGADGFGYKFRNNQHVKVPQIGNVVIEANVEIGANTCIDRGALGSTVLGTGSKIDNLVQIGHNNKIGQHVIMCGQAGVSGSCHIEDYAILAGGVGIADHVTIGQGAVVMGGAGVANDIKAGTQVFGSPAKDKRIAYKEQIALSKLPELLKKVQFLEEKLAALTNA